jgi:hypothetical protein
MLALTLFPVLVLGRTIDLFLLGLRHQGAETGRQAGGRTQAREDQEENEYGLGHLEREHETPW